MAASLSSLPIKRKLMLVIMLTSSFALLLMGSAIIIYERVTFRHALAANMNVLAQIIGANSTAALAFDDHDNAREILGALSAESQVTAAAIYDQNGRIFASFPQNVSSTLLPARPGRIGYEFIGSHLIMFRPILQQGTRLGTIYLQADLEAMYSRFRVYGLLLLFVGICSTLAAASLSTRLQRRISLPILELADAATAVSSRHDYSVRASKHGTDEIGQLTDAFNQMLREIGESSTALSASEERLRLALEGSKMGTWDWNLSTNRVTWDDYMYPLFGRTKGQFDGIIDSVIKAIHPDDQSTLRRVLRQAVQEKRDLDVGFRIVDPSDKIRHMSSRGRVFFDSSGTAVRMTGVTMDVTVAKQIEQDLNSAKEAAEAANKEKDQFLAIVSHELRTPLTPVLATIAMLENDKTISDDIHRELEMIRRNIEVEARLIDDLLDINRIVRGKLDLRRQVVDVRPLLEHAMQNYCAGTAVKKNIRVSMEIAASQTHVLVDRSRITQVFWNLLQNACKFTPSGGAINVRAYNEDCRAGTSHGGPGAEAALPDLVVEISDTGIGISRETLPRIFNAFEQGERSRNRSFGGLGLGLAISRAIMDLHEGSISATSAGKDKGATFIIRLHTVKPAPIGSPEPRPLPEKRTTRRSLRVLVVEDHRDTADQFSRLLKRAGHEVICASSIKEAQTYASTIPAQDRSWAFDLLISDLSLPDGSGLDLMRGLAERYQIRGIALSGYGTKEDIQNSIAAGFSHHFTKPVNWQELETAIQKIGDAMLRREEQPAPK